MVTDGMLAMVRLAEACNAIRPPDPDLSLVRDADLERMQLDAARKLYGMDGS